MGPTNACWLRSALRVLWSVPARRYPQVWLNHCPGQIAMSPDAGAHVCLRSPDEGAVRAFHAAALAGGCKGAGLPGPRHATITMYFAAFVFDLGGNKVKADPAQSP